MATAGWDGRRALAFGSGACDTSPVRLSRSRVLLRAVLLMAASAFMFWKAWGAHLAAAAAGAPEAVLLSRVALVEALLGILGLAAAAVALLALRARKRTHTLRLSGLERSDQEEGARTGNRPGGS